MSTVKIISEYEEQGGDSPCWYCGRQVEKSRYWVHQTTDGELTDDLTLTEEEGSQGFFPIGSRCKRFIPSDFLFDFKH